jgi:putative cell wall-binding protein
MVQGTMVAASDFLGGVLRRTESEDGMTRTATRRKAVRRHRTPAKSSQRKPARRKLPHARTTKRSTGRYWSRRVTKESDALDLKGGVFKLKDPKRIAKSLKRSAEKSHRRKTTPYRSALSMLVFFINRAGKNLSASRRRTLDQAKVELRKQFGRE